MRNTFFSQKRNQCKDNEKVSRFFFQKREKYARILRNFRKL